MATNYKYSKELWLNRRPQLHVIKTKISNICTETICKPLTDTSYYGINGGFFDSRDYQEFSRLWLDERDKIEIEGFEINKYGNRILSKKLISKENFVPHEVSYYKNG
ncbi:hypothetical protein [Priestia flexa]|uniref:hypothetical protein n=1 Tax=Priestia flexa TaxID=86664 RepID=UPI001CD6BAD6|nr:hypothetical protein [Priestia flexa]MCA1204123.1 hypothetical protein [Priestia flexa]